MYVYYLQDRRNSEETVAKIKVGSQNVQNNSSQIRGTGGGPSKTFEDPVLKLVAEITGRGITGIENVDDCDADTMGIFTAKYENNILVIYFYQE